MEQLKETDEEAWGGLSEKNPGSWARSHFSTHCKCNAMHYNMCESFNGKIIPARSKTILPLLEELRVFLMQRMQQSREAMRAYQGALCPNIQTKLDFKKKDFCNCITV